jgi:hypothetical protein
MRCPKCSYTSFDNPVTCEKCGRDLTEIVGELHGTSLRVESPLFLGAALDVPSGEEMLDIGGGTGISDTAMDEGGDFSLGVEEEVAEVAVAEEPDPAVGAAEVAEEGEEKLSLDFEGLDLSDLTPEDKQEPADESGDVKKESPLDLWALDSSTDEDLADLFDDLVPGAQSPKEVAPAGESSAAENAVSKAAADETGDAGDDKPKEDDTPQ